VPFPSGTNCVWYGAPETCSINVIEVWQFDRLTCTDAIALPATQGVLELRFRSFGAGEDDGQWDRRRPQVRVVGQGS
jgi:hypothetical protein